MAETIPFLERPRKACCDAETFWDGFMFQWRKRHGADALFPDFLCKAAWSYWRKGMTGFEAAETCFRRLNAGRM